MKPLTPERRKEMEQFWREAASDGVMKPKLLTKEWRDRIENWCADALPGEAELVDHALAAEAFWREAVKNSKAIHYSEEWTSCSFCELSGADEVHEPGCPWRLANS